MAIQLRATWGISHTGTAQGVYTDVGQGAEPVAAPLHDELGRVIGQAKYDTRKNGEYTILVKAGVALPASGSQITIGSVTGYVQNVRLLESNSNYQRASVTIEAFSQCTEMTAVSQDTTATVIS